MRLLVRLPRIFWGASDVVGCLSLSLAAAIQSRADLTPHETLVGLMMALAADRTTGTVWLKRSTMQARTRLSTGQLTRALSGLVGKGVVERHRTPRATVYRFPSPSIYREMDGSLVDNLTPRPPRAHVPGYTDEQWEALRVMMRDVWLSRRAREEHD